jgi:hypothetical protein
MDSSQEVPQEDEQLAPKGVQHSERRPGAEVERQVLHLDGFVLQHELDVQALCRGIKNEHQIVE